MNTPLLVVRQTGVAEWYGAGVVQVGRLGYDHIVLRLLEGVDVLHPGAHVGVPVRTRVLMQRPSEWR